MQNMKSSKKREKSFYITTTLPYVNAEPHIGFALEIIAADVLARFYNMVGYEVFFNTGTDEHGYKLYKEALKLGMSPKEFVDKQYGNFKKLKEILNVNFNSFIRTTDTDHIEAAQEFWRRCERNGDVYKKKYRIKYCIGCELEKTDSELIDGRCPLHPDQKIEVIEEENYFFRFSRYQKKLLTLYKNNPEFVLPKKRFNEIIRFVNGGLEDFSISRLKNKMPWGVEVPNDRGHVMYVWFDALVNYISAIGWPYNIKKFNKWWPVTQIAGKDNLRQQSAMWQAMLMSAGIKPSKQIFINGFITVNGQKMSKSMGNFITPLEMVEKFGIDGTRYILLSFGSFGEDTSVNRNIFIEKYNADLANGLGNLVLRILKLAGDIQLTVSTPNRSFKDKLKIKNYIKKMEFGKALDYIWDFIQKDNEYIEKNKPWELIKNDKQKFRKVMKELVKDLFIISEFIAPFLPNTADKIKEAIKTKRSELFFQRIE